jgi:hypothetical protein
MTTQYKLLLNDVCTFKPVENKEGDEENIRRFQISIKNPKNLMAYEVWNDETPKANAGTSKIFSIAPSVLVNCINNYNLKVKEVNGFTYKPTAFALLGIVSAAGNNSGGLLILEEFYISWENNSESYEPIMIINAYTKPVADLEEFADFPNETVNSKIRMNINGFQSTAMLDIVDNEFVEDWLKPTYNKLRPYPYIGPNVVEPPEKVVYDRNGEKVNFAYGGHVSIKNISSGTSRITVTNPQESLQYLIWEPVNPFINKNLLPAANGITLSTVYTYFKHSEKRASKNNLPLDEYAWRPNATFDLIDENGKSITYLGKIVNMVSDMGEPNQAPKIMIDVDTRNFELYKNKRLPTLPDGDFLMLMDIDGPFGL